ncbi:MAG: glucose-6-phosphate isomerase [Pseudomonadales bacterium]|jgi:glucose-6-phosphate isomerase|tara:strand:- start:1058 stop:2590 length:1533 start_codon:yes stop_codon:yes gene_type:complete
MSEPFYPPKDPAWQTLKALASHAPSVQTAMKDADWQHKAHLQFHDLTLNLSHHRMRTDIFEALLGLLNASPFAKLQAGLFSGEAINLTENRAVGHTRIRTPEFIRDDPTLLAIRNFTQGIHDGALMGANHRPFEHIVNIGIGGSDLGPKMVCQALDHPDTRRLACHFVANVDGAEINAVLRRCDPETTLIVIASKTFTTQETLMNARTAHAWLQASLPDRAQRAKHLVALTTAKAKAIDFGVAADQIFAFDEDIGGRYSLWSSIGLTIALQSGYDAFEALLLGGHAMDQHFSDAPLAQNLPVILALLSVWYGNFLGAQSQAVIPYCERLSLFPAFLQQLDMESLGKSTTREGQSTHYQTGLITWGQTGTNGQHAFFQLLHQGTHLVPLDFIGFAEDPQSSEPAHRALRLNLAAQVTALAQGQSGKDPHRDYAGNKPSSVIMLDALTPFNLGMLIALYEHKVFTCSAIWNINAFDQWGVELGKALATAFDLGDIEQPPVTQALLNQIKLNP